ncbi:MAG TPA: peptidylprolyl isomerase [Candidatus Moranbacteria bacterium]|nr:peptidylprolyl isomerase [Candidatus Moranbacteria bacterium]
MNNKKEKIIQLKTIFKTIAILLVIYILAIGAIIYFFPKNENKIVRITASIIPYPVAISKSGIVTESKLSSQLLSAKKFYENQDFSQVGLRVDFSTEDGKKRLAIKEKNILNKLIDDSIVETEAKKRGIKITEELIDQEVDRKLKEYGTGEYLKDNLEKLYGWSIDDFKKNIVKPDLYQEKLFADIKKTDSSFAEAKKKIEEAQSDLKKGVIFSEVAKKYSKGESAKNGGALGWFSSEQMLPEVAEVIFSLEKNKQSEIIESPIGFHIVKLEDKKVQNGENMAKISQIFIPTETLNDWLSGVKKNYKMFVPIRRFFWNNETRQVEFRDKTLKDYEADLLKNPINDPSIIF